MEKRSLQLVLLIMIGMLIAMAAPTRAEDPPGKKIFLDTKCNTCHSIDSEGIKKTMASSKAPDLSAVGDEHDAAWIAKYISKEESKNDKKHVKGWTGTKEDLDTLSKWLETLKTKK